MVAGRKIKNLNIEEILADRRHGLTIKELADKYEVCHSTIRERLRSIGKYKPDKSGKGAQRKAAYGIENWDKPNKLEPEDIEFLKKYDLERFIK